MKKYLIYIYVCTTTLFLISCDSYVDIETEGKLTPQEVENYRYLLNNTSVFDLSYGLVNVLSDDITIRADHAQYFEDSYSGSSYYTPYREAYKWKDAIYETQETDNSFNAMYTALYYANVVISEVMDSKDGTEAEKLALKGEAQVHRAFVFLDLMNGYAKAYNSDTANSDLGIPILTSPIVEGDITRATVEEVYNQIVSDLIDATNSGLPDSQTGRNVGFPSKASAYALLARTYLYMGNYEEALIAAEASLALQNTLMNLEDYKDVFDYSFPKRHENPELLLSKYSSFLYAYAPTLLSFSDAFLNTFDTNDLRYRLFTRSNSALTWGALTEGRSYCKGLLTGEKSNAGPTVPEMMLIKAECLARKGSATSAITIINELREKRFETTDYTALVATDADDALTKVLEARRKELMGNGGFRWADLKRLNNDARFSETFTRTYLTETFTHTAGDPFYLFPFAEKLFDYAPDLEQN